MQFYYKCSSFRHNKLEVITLINDEAISQPRRSSFRRFITFVIFQLHRLLMILVAVFVLIGFIAIFVEVGELEVSCLHFSDLL